MAQVCFSHTGADAPDQLSPQRRIVYQGTAPLPDKSSDITRQITNSVSIPAALTKQLSALIRSAAQRAGRRVSVEIVD